MRPLLMQNWSHVMSYVNKALATPDLTESSAKNVVFLKNYVAFAILLL